MSKEKVKQYVFLTILMSVINFCVAGVLIGTTVINLKGAEAAEENIQQLNQQIAVIDQETEKQTEKQTEILVKETSKELTGPSEESKTEEETEGETDSESNSEQGSDSETAAEMWNLDLDSLVSDAEANGEKWAVSVQNLSDGSVCEKNGKVSMQSASVIKVFIMATVYDRICYPQNKQTAIYISEQYDGELRDLLSNMITVSDNDAANRLVELLGNGDFNVGKEVVNAFCSANGYSNTHLGRRFMDTNPADDNYTSSSDCRKILSDIYNGVCVNSEASEKMLQFLSAQTRKGKIPSGIPSGIQSANKTGEMPEGYGFGCIENDIAIVFGEQQDYVICILSNDLGGRNESAIERIRNISSYVYEVLK